jgi:hypothetical protein
MVGTRLKMESIRGQQVDQGAGSTGNRNQGLISEVILRTVGLVVELGLVRYQSLSPHSAPYRLGMNQPLD